MTVAIPDYVEPFEGWRVWRVSRDDGPNGPDFRLLSVAQETVWPAREELLAECLRRRILARLRRTQRHDPPVKSCACGIYATSLDRLRSYLRVWGDRRTLYVFGRVHLWGTVVESEHGWRSSRAYPAEIIVPTPTGRPAAGTTAEAIADGLGRYAVPVVVLPHSTAKALDVVAHEHGRDGQIGSVR